MSLQVLTSKKKMIKALEQSLGIVSKACEIAGISRVTHYNYYNNDIDYKKQVDSIADMALDFVESKLYELIRDGDTAATIFYLKTKGKKRGYDEKKTLDIAVSKKAIQFDFGDTNIEDVNIIEDGKEDN